uniref:Glycosyltransferase n=1 Tax=Allium cepa TaxID=4679 RepID=R9TPK0_ALLCE|nr:UFGT2 [Allium cepa]
MANHQHPLPHIAILPTPGMGHLIPLTELAKRLVNSDNFSVTFLYFAESNSKSQQAYLSSLPPSITSISLPPVDLGDLPSNAAIETRMSVASLRSVPSVANILQNLKSKHNLVAFVADLFGADTFDAARELNVPAYMFFPSNFLALSLFLNLPKLHEEIKCEYRDLEQPVKLPGCVPIPGKDLLHPLQDRKDEAYSWLVHHGEKYSEAEGILANSFYEFEPEAVEILSRVEPGRPPIYAVGPLIQTGTSDGVDASGCLAWLNEQPRGSVIFVSFGSGGTLSTEQTRELALGLEMSGQRFLWVVRSRAMRCDATIRSESKRDPFEFCPKGSWRGRRGWDGGVIWAPQIKVLSHVSTGGFLTHCGWNSTLESVVNGVPMIGWPLFAEQRQNAVMLAEGAKVALRVRFGVDGVARKEDISDVVRELMEGEMGKKVRFRVKELQLAGIRALEEEGRSSKNLKEVVGKWKGLGAEPLK